MVTSNTVNNVVSGFKRIFEHPEDNSNIRTFDDWSRYVDFNWSYYIGSMFDNQELSIASIEEYVNKYDLYSNTRLLINPARQLVNFYVDTVYPGNLSYDGQNLNNGQVNAIPFSYKVEQALKVAIGQIWEWSNFQAQKSIIVRQGAAIGSAFVEIIDDIKRGQVTTNVIWPGFVRDLVLDTMGNVKSYTITYRDVDKQGPYTYKKTVDNIFIRYFRDDEPFDYFGNGATFYEHGYGFAPAVWVKHVDYGSDYGMPSIAGSIGKIDEICGHITHVSDILHKLMESPMIFWAEGVISDALEPPSINKTQGTNTDDFGSLVRPKKGLSKRSLILKGPPNGHVETLAPVIQLQYIFQLIEVLQSEIAKDHPEITYYDDLRAMSQLTGIAVERLVGDVSTKVAEVSANYDRQLIKLFQMCVAIGGKHANDGSWLGAMRERGMSELTQQQKKFLSYDLTSYAAGKLELNIEPRPLIKKTVEESGNERTAYWTGVQAAVDGGDVLELVLEDDGVPEDRIKAILAKKEANKALANAIGNQQSNLPNQQNNLPNQQNNQQSVDTNNNTTNLPN